MERKWWKEGTVYQIYPRSFMDSNGDGIGDLRGIISRLDYLQELGIDIVWLSPVYQSPNDDNGYDISDYQKIMDEFGTMADWEEMLAEMHKRGIRLVMDLVVNHTSDEHSWFLESRSSKDNPKRDYYIWRAPQDGAEPNNWGSVFSGSAWQFDQTTGEYYLHLFSVKQPDLNWENPQVREEVYNMMTWWLDKGVDGFRMDVINFISKNPELPSMPSSGDNRYEWGGEHFMNGPRIHEYMQEMNRRVLSNYDVMTVGETPGVTPDEAQYYVGEDRGELNMVFQFEHMDIDSGPGGKWDVTPWKLTDLKRILGKWQTDLHGKGWNSLYLCNHDQPRSVSRFGDDTRFRLESAKMLGTMLHTLQGTPYVYQGEELGMTNVKFATLAEYKDIEIHNMYREKVIEGGESHDKIMNAIYIKGRDNARTPMQWDASANAGFTTGTPWIAVNPNYTEINAQQAVSDPTSVFNYYKKLIQNRRDNLVFVYGEYRSIHEENDRIYSYLRTWNDERALVILNFFADPVEYVLPDEIGFAGKQLLISNYSVDESQDIRRFTLRPYEARVYRLA
ncbi:MAG: alpha-glucosidase [Tumebacillaceae bacterium]